jgi:predicted transposase YbfD/YdcC
MGCQTEIAELIIKKEADYVLALKGNQGTLHRDVQDLFAYAQEIDFQAIAERSLILKTKKQIRSRTVQEKAVEVRKTPSKPVRTE